MAQQTINNKVIRYGLVGLLIGSMMFTGCASSKAKHVEKIVVKDNENDVSKLREFVHLTEQISKEYSTKQLALKFTKNNNEIPHFGRYEIITNYQKFIEALEGGGGIIKKSL